MRYAAIVVAVLMLSACDAARSPETTPESIGAASAGGAGSGGVASSGGTVAARGTSALPVAIPAASAVASTPAIAAAPFRPKPADEADVCEAVFRHLLEQGGRAQPRICLSIRDEDPDAAFFKRFNAFRFPLSPGSKYEQGTSVLYAVSRLDWIDADTVDVIGGSYQGNLGSVFRTYRVRRNRGVWTVTEKEGGTVWVS